MRGFLILCCRLHIARISFKTYGLSKTTVICVYRARHWFNCIKLKMEQAILYNFIPQIALGGGRYVYILKPLFVLLSFFQKNHGRNLDYYSFRILQLMKSICLDR